MIDGIHSFIYFVAVFAVVLGPLIFIHELGHFLLARLFGVGVETFSLGYGSRLFGKKIGRTDYRVSLLPLGGYCRMVGEEPGEEISPEDIPVSFTHQHVLKRVPIVAAGPIFNVLLALVLLFGLFYASGLLVLRPTVGSVLPDSPAEAGGMEVGDLVLSIDGKPVSSWDEMTEMIIGAGGIPLSFTVRRGEEVLSKTITPAPTKTKNIFDEDVEQDMIGIGYGGETFSRELGMAEALVESIDRTYYMAELTVVTVVKLIQGRIPPKMIGGPIMIAQMAGRTARVGFAPFILLVAFVSINLAIINLLPVPVLDGGHLMFFTIELILGRPVSPGIRERAHQVGIFLLLLLMIYVFYNDIARFFTN